MKKIMLFAAACVALAACSKEIDNTTPEKVTAFEKGQKVTLTVNTGDQTKVSSELVTSGEDKDKVNFAWETGDKIKVTVGTESAEFTLTSGAGTATAEFTGTMPEGGETFNVQYPVDDPELSSQTYVANGLPKDKMKMAATGCTLGSDFTLTPQNAALRLNLYGLNREVSSIVVTNTTANPNVSYTLNCSSAVRVGNSAETATPFLLVVPAGASGWTFKVEVTAGNATTNPDPVPTYTEGSYTSDGIVIETGKFTTTSAQTFTAAQILNMPAKSIATVWAPVNCGYDATNYKYGKTYQWGRAVGGGYSGKDAGGVYQQADAFAPSGTTQNTNPSDDVFYKGVSSWYDWYTTTGNQLSGWPMKSGDAGYVANKIANPCPSGWRVPTYDELNALMTNKSSWTEKDGQKGYYFSGSAAYSASAPSIFLPAAGYRDGSTGSSTQRGYQGKYMSSAVDGNKAAILFFGQYTTNMSSTNRAGANSVRCVKE